MKTSTPFQYSAVGQFIKKILHTKVGAFIAYHVGIAGFNRIDAQVHKFVRIAGDNEKLRRGEYLLKLEEGFGIYRAGKLSHAFNARVNKGGDLIASLITGAAQNSITSPLPPKYVALSTATLTPSATDTTLASESVASGLIRALGTQGSYVAPTVLDGAASYAVTKTFTSGVSATILSCALFDAVTSGNLFVEGNLAASAVLASGDQLTITWTVNL